VALITANNSVKQTHFRGTSFVADTTSLVPLQRSAYPLRYSGYQRICKIFVP